MIVPVEIFFGFIGLSVILAIIGFIRNPQIPVMLVVAGMFILSITVSTTKISFGEAEDFIQNIFINSTDSMNQPTRTGGTIVRNTQITMFGEYLTNENSVLRNMEMNQITMRIDRIGSNVAGTIYFGVWGHNTPPTLSNAKFIVGQLRANDTDADISFYTITRNDTKTYVMQTGDVVGLFYDNGDASNHITVDSNATASSFDGTNTIRRTFSEATNTWTETTTSDITGKISLAKTQMQESHTTQNEIAFDNRPKVLFSILGAFFMLIGGLMVYRD